MLLKTLKSALVFLIITMTHNSGISQTNSNQNCFVSILDFGAKMDGVSDDTEAIQSSLKTVGYAFIPASEIGARVESTIVLQPNQNIFGVSRASIIKSYVPAQTFTIRAEQVTNIESVHIKDLSIDIQTRDANGIQAFETRNVYIDNVLIQGNRRANIGIQLNGGSENGSAWNQITRYTITKCNIGLELTSNTKNNFCNRNYIGFGLIQSCQIGVRMYRASTNTILSCPQGCPIGMKLEKARLNTIDTYIENSETNSIILDDKSNFNTISGQWKIDKYKDLGKSNLINLNRPKNQPTKLH